MFDFTISPFGASLRKKVVLFFHNIVNLLFNNALFALLLYSGANY